MAGERNAFVARVKAGCLAAGLLLSPVPLAAAPIDGAVAAAVESRVSSDGRLRDFYQKRDYRPLWIRGDTIGPEADQLIRLLETANLDGLNPRSFRLDDLNETVARARTGSPDALAQAERQLSATLAAYGRALGKRKPRVDIVYVDKQLRPGKLPRGATLEAAAAAPSLSRYLQNVRNPIYGSLREGLTKYHTRWGDLPAVPIAPGAALKSGSGPRVIALRQRLGLDPRGGYDGKLRAAVRDFQAAHGLDDDGIAGNETIAALNRDPREYERLIRLNLERARALPADLGKRFIHVDAVAARLWLYENGQVKDSMKVVVGKPSEQTPMMAGLIRYQVNNPYWNVPPDLVRRRIAPRALQNGGASLRGYYEVLDGWHAGARILDPAAIDWQAVADGRTEVRVRQMPGEGNMMGDMKFMFPNQYGIYLHDTPDKSLFSQEDRWQSSGCVRVEDAERLSRWLFAGRTPPDNGRPEQRVDLAEPVPIYITYLTASSSGKGMRLVRDPYGRDATFR